MSSHQKGLFKFFKSTDVCLGVMAHWMEHWPVNQRGLQSDSQSGHMPGKKRSVVCVEKMLWLTERVRSGLWGFTVEICPRGRQTRCRGQPTTAGVHWETGREAGDSQHVQNILIRLRKSFAPAWLPESHGRLGSTGINPDGGRCFLTRSPQVVLHWNVRKTFHFREVCVLAGRMNLCYLRILWNGRDGGQRKEPPLAPPKAGLCPKEVMMPLLWTREGVLQWELVAESQQVTGNTYGFPSY